MRTKDIVIIGMMSAIIITLQVTLRFLPNIELVSLLVILFTLVFGSRTIYIIYVFVLAEGTIYGFGTWWFTYLYVWTILYIITYLLRKQRSALQWAIVSGGFGLSFGALTAVPYFIIGGISYGVAYWIQGIPFDLIHGSFNFIIALVLYKPLYSILNRINGQIENIKS